MPELNSTVTVLPSSGAADIVRQQLEAAGIESAVVEADGAFQLQVAEGDFSRAMLLLFPMPAADKAEAIAGLQAAPWKCAYCGEEVQPVSDVCWACGKPRAGAAPPPVKISPPAPPSFPYPTPPAVELPPAPSSVPAASPRSAATAAPLEAVFSSTEGETGEPEALTSALSSMAAAPPNQEADGARSPTAPRASSSAAQPAPRQPAPAKPAATAASLEATEGKRRPRAPMIEEPNPWKSPWLIGIWVVIGLAICLIAWLALR